MACFLALDQGTTSSRALVLDAEGALRGAAQHEITQHFPAPGQVEHDADEIWETQWRAAREAHAAAGGPPITAVGIASQRETVVVFERVTGRPVHRAIVWQDRRTAEVLRALREAGHEAAVRARTGLPLDPYFSAAKIAHVLDAVPGARARAERGELVAGTVDTWLLWKLTGGAVVATEPSNASRTALYDLREGGWSEDLLARFKVPRQCLAEVRDSVGAFGVVAETGWPITGVLGDQQAALFGHGCTESGSAKCSYGTGAFLLQTCGASVLDPGQGLLATVAWRIGGRDTFALEGSVMVCGAVVQWLRDGLGILDHAAEVEALAAQCADSGGLVLVPAFAGLGTPRWDPDARGLLIGLTRGTGRAHIARAALESIALQVYELQVAIEAATGVSIRELRVDGGAAGNDLLMQLQADISDLTVRRPYLLETTAVGAARAAMVGAGCPPPAGFRGSAIDAELRPGGALRDREGLLRRWTEAVERSRGWARVT